MQKLNNVIRINTSVKDFFKVWLKSIKLFHTLTEREIQVLACILHKRFELSDVISDEAILDDVVLNLQAKKALMKECNISLLHIQVIFTKFKKLKIINDNRINPRFIPALKKNDTNFLLLFYFDFNDKQDNISDSLPEPESTDEPESSES